ncbi:uncharacterized protein LOC114359875 [Ostrinia furnacalis]|uniref:uncharacterized protein LOC114359875 n=1 Tax=Ostrinia furnacalis TaxID=93504 RepID=UPI00103DC38D|nr:uncharacterized protein LOC114359875 [Ostrinia furnacalis]
MWSKKSRICYKMGTTTVIVNNGSLTAACIQRLSTTYETVIFCRPRGWMIMIVMEYLIKGRLAAARGKCDEQLEAQARAEQSGNSKTEMIDYGNHFSHRMSPAE